VTRTTAPPATIRGTHNDTAVSTAPLDSSADIAIQKNTPVTIVLETRNFATAGAVVSVRVANKYGGHAWYNATLDGGGTSVLSTWRSAPRWPPALSPSNPAPPRRDGVGQRVAAVAIFPAGM
jgi:hypothetical protein